MKQQSENPGIRGQDCDRSESDKETKESDIESSTLVITKMDDPAQVITKMDDPAQASTKMDGPANSPCGHSQDTADCVIEMGQVTGPEKKGSSFKLLASTVKKKFTLSPKTSSPLKSCLLADHSSAEPPVGWDQKIGSPVNTVWSEAKRNDPDKPSTLAGGEASQVEMQRQVSGCQSRETLDANQELVFSESNTRRNRSQTVGVGPLPASSEGRKDAAKIFDEYFNGEGRRVTGCWTPILLRILNWLCKSHYCARALLHLCALASWWMKCAWYSFGVAGCREELSWSLGTQWSFIVFYAISGIWMVCVCETVFRYVTIYLPQALKLLEIIELKHAKYLTEARTREISGGFMTCLGRVFNVRVFTAIVSFGAWVMLVAIECRRFSTVAAMSEGLPLEIFFGLSAVLWVVSTTLLMSVFACFGTMLWLIREPFDKLSSIIEQITGDEALYSGVAFDWKKKGILRIYQLAHNGADYFTKAWNNVVHAGALMLFTLIVVFGGLLDSLFHEEDTLPRHPRFSTALWVILIIVLYTLASPSSSMKRTKRKITEIVEEDDSGLHTGLFQLQMIANTKPDGLQFGYFDLTWKAVSHRIYILVLIKFFLFDHLHIIQEIERYWANAN